MTRSESDPERIKIEGPSPRYAMSMTVLFPFPQSVELPEPAMKEMPLETPSTLRRIPR